MTALEPAPAPGHTAGTQAPVTYRVFGGALRSALPLPGLARLDVVAADWTLDVADHAPPTLHESPVGEEALDVGSVALARIASGYRLRYEDTGCFDVSADGTRLVWYVVPGADPELVRVDVCGRVLGLALHAAGAICLHASAVAIPSGAIAFVAPKAHGKSSLAAALLRRRARLVTDDTLPVLPDLVPRVRPGIHQLRLRQDSADALVDPARVARAARGGKQVVDHDDAATRCDVVVPLLAIYELEPARELTSGAAVERMRIMGPQAAIALVRHARPAALLGGPEASAVLARAAAVASRVSVYRLSVAAGLDRIDDVASTVLAWHAGGAPT